MSRAGWIVVVGAVLVSACGEKKDAGNTGVSGGTSGSGATANRVNQDTGTGAGLAQSPAVGASAGTATAADAGAMGSTGTAMGTTGSTATMDAGAKGSSASAAAATTDAGSMANTQASAISDADRTQAQQIYTQRCAACHGATGKGDGAAAVALNPKPRAFGDAAWQASVTDEHIEKIISLGGGAVGKSPLMPPNPDIAGKPVVAALREHVRSFAPKGAK